MSLNIYKIFSFFDLLRADSLSLFYQGITHDDITDKLISLSDTNIRSQAGLASLRKRVSFAISECFQNVIRHKEEPKVRQDELSRPSMFMVRNQGNGYYIGSVNLLKSQKAGRLKKQLQNLNNLNAEELRQMYLQMLPSIEFSEKGGAGLGLIEMARKSKQKLDFDFLRISRGFSLFLMQLSFNEGAQSDKAPSLVETRNLYESLFQQQVLLLYKSDFSQEGMMPLIDMMENNLEGNANSQLVYKKVLYVLVELFQNIIKHATTENARQEGILLVSATAEGYELCTGNFLDNSNIEALQHHLGRLNHLNEEELRLLYRKELIGAHQRSKGGAGLGLIEIARYSKKPFQFSFLPIDNKISFFSLSITI
jgi:hypothetical protein